MILVTVGTERFPFNRLMEWIDSLIQQNLVQPDREEIIIQYGSCTITPQGTKIFLFYHQKSSTILLLKLV